MPNRVTMLLAVSAMFTPTFQFPAASQDRDDRPSKRFEWVDQRAGDCHQSGVLMLYRDGRAVWSATTWTDHSSSGDVWHETLKVLNSQNQELFGFGVWDSPRVWPGDQGRWQMEGRFSPDFFDPIATATSGGSC